MNDLDLARVLREHAYDVNPIADLAGGARRRARRIQVRRRVVAGTVAAVAVVAAVPTALSLGGTTSTAPEPADPMPEPGGTTVLTLAGLAEGVAPAIGWVDGTTFHRADGLDVEVPESVDDLVAYGDGAAGFDYSTGEIWFSDGSSIPGFGPVLSADGESVAWYFDEGTASGIRVGPAQGGDSTDTAVASDIPAGVRVQPVGFLGDRDLVSNVYEQGESVRVRRDTFDGSSSTPWDVEMVSAVSSPTQLVAGRTSVTDFGSCWAVLPADGGAARWDTCDHSLDEFSPDGRYLLAGPAYRDGAGDASAAVLDAETGTVLQEFTRQGDGVILDTAFEDDEHLLIVLSDEGRSAIVRCDLDGECERATPAVRGGYPETPFGLGGRP